MPCSGKGCKEKYNKFRTGAVVVRDAEGRIKKYTCPAHVKEHKAKYKRIYFPKAKRPPTVLSEIVSKMLAEYDDSNFIS